MALRIKQLRMERGLTQAQLAEMANVSRPQLAQIESEKRPANTLRLKSIAAALKVQVDELFVGDGETDRLMSLARALESDDLAILVRMAEALAAKAKQAE